MFKHVLESVAMNVAMNGTDFGGARSACNCPSPASSVCLARHVRLSISVEGKTQRERERERGGQTCFCPSRLHSDRPFRLPDPYTGTKGYYGCTAPMIEWSSANVRYCLAYQSRNPY